MDQIGELIGSDLALSAKVLQLVNSSFFGLAQHVSSPKHAASLLGLNVIRPLVLFVSAYSQCEELGLGGYSLSESIAHSLSVAVHARAIATFENAPSHTIDDSYIAGMMHDIGKLILVVNLKNEYSEILEASSKTGTSLWECERSALGTTHAEVGAHLLGLWGFNNSVAEAVAYHHQPQSCFHHNFSPLAALHFANVHPRPDSQKDSDGRENDNRDYSYLQKIASEERLAKWQELA
jgi:HD-like signal output (HDOD) protein